MMLDAKILTDVSMKKAWKRKVPGRKIFF